MKTRSPRRRLAGATLIGFDTSVWKNLANRNVRGDRKAGQRSKLLAAKVGQKKAG